MKKIAKYIILGILIFSSNSCINSFLDIPSENEMNTGDFYETADDFNAAVIAAYAKLQSQVSYYFELLSWRSDYLDLSSATSGTQDRYNICKFTETSDNEIIENAWANFYNGIYRCNMVTSNIGNAGFDESLRNQYEAEARFIRALTYFNIVRIWGDAPVILEPVTAEESLKTGRSSVENVYKAIEADLLFAADNLPGSYDSDEFGRATSGAAKALLGKVYLTEEKFSDAEEILTPLVGKYGILGDIADVFDPDNETNNEIIFSVRFDKETTDEGHGYWFSVTDLSVSSLTSELTGAYSSSDKRAAMVTYSLYGTTYLLGKYYDEKSASTSTVGNDFIVLRYADVLLMLSEALNQQSYKADGDAFKYLNEVHERAGLTAYSSSDLPDQSSFRTAVLNERFLEFPLEGQRWFDLVRTNTAVSEMADIGITISSYQYIYPVPESEIEKINNTDLFYQNPGY